ncbi:MAG: hypothetical protein D6800_14335, partial [Candidatus Zixiibacteriota bacterium]
MPNTAPYVDQVGVDKTPPVDPVPAKRHEKLIRPRRHLLFGTTVAFAFEKHSLEMAAARHFGLRARLTAVEKVYIPKDITDPEKRHRFLRKQIADFYAAHGRFCVRASIVVGGRETAVRTAYLPKLKPRDMADAVFYEAQKQLPFPLDDAYFGFRRTSQVTIDTTRRCRLAIVAATKRTIAERLEVFAPTRFRISEAVFGKDVTGQLLQRLPEFSQNRAYALVKIGYERSEITFYRGTDLEFTHTISLGTSFLGNRSDNVVFEYFSESLAGELQNALDYYSGQFSETFSNRIYIYGDLSLSDELVSFLSDRFGFSFEAFPA